MADFLLTPMTPHDASAISRWRYGPGYALHDMRPSDAVSMTDPAYSYFAVHQAGVLAGFACFGEDARVYGGPAVTEGLDLGCGMAPTRCGKGEGLAFVEAVADFADARFLPAELRLSVPEANRRAVKVYIRAGFSVRCRFVGLARGGIHTFLLMAREPG